MSLQYGDVYFSRASGLDETRHVFLEHNHLPQRWRELAPTSFTIAETGFGTGLNFLCAWQLWLACAPSDARLHFVSFEKYPLTPDDLGRALALWPQLADESAALLAQYGMLAPGWHRLVFAHGRVTLTLIIGDVQSSLPLLRAKVDAWFLDGFAPSKNPEMWQPDLYAQMARLSHAATTFATFTSAGLVRRGLQQAGFSVDKVAGHGRKRDMLRGRYAAPASTGSDSVTDRHAIVIGGGIAGSATSHALARRGWRVSLVERHGRVAAEASGNPLGILYPRLSGQDIVLSRLAQTGFLHTVRLLRQLASDAETYASCGLLQLAFDAREAKRCADVAKRELPNDLVHAVEADQASALAGIALSHGGLYFPAAGWVDPVRFCQALVQHPAIHLITGEMLQLRRDGERWQVHSAAGLLATAPVVVIAAANASAGFDQTAHLPLEAVRGQLSCFNATTASAALQTVVCTEGYVSPAVDGRHCLGATFTPDDTDAEVRQQDHLANLALLAGISPELYMAANEQHLSGRAALRCATPDYLPMAGPVLDHAALVARPPRHTAAAATLPWLPGLYVNTGHGSKGLINAPFCAELLASAIAGEPLPADAQLLAALDPNRFLLRKFGLKKLVQGLAAYPLL